MPHGRAKLDLPQLDQADEHFEGERPLSVWQQGFVAMYPHEALE